MNTQNIIPIFSLKGGAGRTTVCVELAKLLANAGRRVLLIDTDIVCGGAYEQAGVSRYARTPAPAPTPSQFDIAACYCEDVADELEHYDEYDDIVIDLRPHLFHRILLLVSKATFPLLLTSADPGELKAADIFFGEMLRLQFEKYSRRRGSGSYADLRKILSAGEAELLKDALLKYRFGILLNRKREASECIQLDALCHALALRYGIFPYVAGTLSFEERRWFYERKLADGARSPNDDLIHKELEDVKITILRQHDPSPKIFLPDCDEYTSPRLFLGLSDADNDAKTRYRRLWEGYRRDNGLVQRLFGNDFVENTVKRLETANRRLLLADDNEQPVKESFAQIVSRSGYSLPEIALMAKIPPGVLEKFYAGKVFGLKRSYLRAYFKELSLLLNIDENIIRQSISGNA